jgi:hypothetical protein
VKKVLAGCLIVLVIALIGFGVAGYYAYRAMRPVVENGISYLDKAREVTRLGEDIKNKSAFEPPANGELTESQVERFLAVQNRVRTDLGDKWGEIEKKASEIRAKADRNSNDWTLSEFTAMFSEIGGIYLDGRKSQIVALNTQRFSEAEYEWVRLRVYEAAGVEMAGNMDLAKIEALARDQASQNGVNLPKMDLPKVPEKNVALVKPHVSKIKEWVPLAVLGL